MPGTRIVLLERVLTRRRATGQIIPTVGRKTKLAGTWQEVDEKSADYGKVTIYGALDANRTS